MVYWIFIYPIIAQRSWFYYSKSLMWQRSRLTFCITQVVGYLFHVVIPFLLQIFRQAALLNFIDWAHNERIQTVVLCQLGLVGHHILHVIRFLMKTCRTWAIDFQWCGNKPRIPRGYLSYLSPVISTYPWWYSMAELLTCKFSRIVKILSYACHWNLIHPTGRSDALPIICVIWTVGCHIRPYKWHRTTTCIRHPCLLSPLQSHLTFVQVSVVMYSFPPRRFQSLTYDLLGLEKQRNGQMLYHPVNW